MVDNEKFVSELQDAILKKTEWFNLVRLQELLEKYKLMQACTSNLYNTLVKKSLIIPDPYCLEKKIRDISVPDATSFSDAETDSVLGIRFSEYKVMLDYICSCFSFTVDNIDIPRIKKLLDLNKVFEWDNMTEANMQSNTHALAKVLEESKNNAPPVVLNMITDSIEKNGELVVRINHILNEFGKFQKEAYKLDIRLELCGNAEFNKEKAYSSPEAEMNEIKHLYVKAPTDKPFYTELVKEIIQEDLDPKRTELQAKLLKFLEVPEDTKRTKRREGFVPKDVLLDAILGISAISPTISQVKKKLILNFELITDEKKGLFAKLGAFFRKLFTRKKKDQIIEISLKDPRTGAVHKEKIYQNKILDELSKKEKLYSSISVKGPEYSKFESSNDNEIIEFINKQITELQNLQNKINSLDAFFKNTIEISLLSLVKGMQIEVVALRNAIANANSKRDEYDDAVQEEKEKKLRQMSEND